MKNDIKNLPDDPEILKQMLVDLQGDVVALQEKYQTLLEQFRLAQHQRFGKSSEAHSGQMELFNEAEVELDTQDEQVEEITYTRSKPKRKPLPKDLPREVIVHDIENKTCDCCQSELHKIGEDKSEKLEFIPAQIKVIEHIRPKYACRHCEQHATTVKIKQAPMPPSPIPKGIATPSLLAQIITAKYQYALPLYRQETMFKQHGIELSRQTMSDWLMKMAHLLEPLYERLKKELLKQTVIQADETTVNVLKEDKTTCYMWLYCSGFDSPKENTRLKNIVLYDYQASRSGQCPRNYLDTYSGYLQVDGYQAYEQTHATLAGCWAHTRRKFMDAQKVQPKGKSGKADMALSQIQKLYAIESKIKDKTANEKHQWRQQHAKPLLDKFYQWLQQSSQNTLPKGKLGEAITYALNQWHKLERYINDGELNIDNNRAERAIKPFVIGRKNWLFSNTASGAKASAMLYSIIETAKANDLIPFDYLTHILTELPKPELDIESILPWSSGSQ